MSEGLRDRLMTRWSRRPSLRSEFGGPSLWVSNWLESVHWPLGVFGGSPAVITCNGRGITPPKKTIHSVAGYVDVFHLGKKCTASALKIVDLVCV